MLIILLLPNVNWNITLLSKLSIFVTTSRLNHVEHRSLRGLIPKAFLSINTSSIWLFCFSGSTITIDFITEIYYLKIKVHLCRLKYFQQNGTYAI